MINSMHADNRQRLNTDGRALRVIEIAQFTLLLLVLIANAAVCVAQDNRPASEETLGFNTSLDPIVRTADLELDETCSVELSNGTSVDVTLLKLEEWRDPIRNAIRQAVVTVRVGDEEIDLKSGQYNLPQRIGSVRIDCPVTKGYNTNGTPAFWGLDKAARVRLWPADEPVFHEGSFRYPVDQRWFATRTWFDNEPVDGGAKILPKIYYHSGLDIGGAEALTQVFAATDALVVSVGNQVLEGHQRETPVAPRYDVVYLMDRRGWYYRYSHLHEISAQILPGRVISQGTQLGVVGKEGASGGWSHLHFEIKARQPSGKWGTHAGYAYLWNAYKNQFQPQLVANARRKQMIFAGHSVTLDASNSWAASGEIVTYQWIFTDGTTDQGPAVTKTYDAPGFYSEVLKITDQAGRIDYDFAEVQVLDPKTPDQYAPRLHATYWPSLENRVGQPITFKVRSFQGLAKGEVWDFGDGTPTVDVQSDANADPLAKDGYAVTQHTYQKPGHYIVTVSRKTESGQTSVTLLHVEVKAK